jgi:hypothetical protein
LRPFASAFHAEIMRGIRAQHAGGDEAAVLAEHFVFDRDGAVAGFRRHTGPQDDAVGQRVAGGHAVEELDFTGIAGRGGFRGRGGAGGKAERSGGGSTKQAAACDVCHGVSSNWAGPV